MLKSSEVSGVQTPDDLMNKKAAAAAGDFDEHGSIATTGGQQFEEVVHWLRRISL